MNEIDMREQMEVDYLTRQTLTKADQEQQEQEQQKALPGSGQ